MAGVADYTRVRYGAPASRPPPNASNPAGTARAPFQTGDPTLSVHQRRAGVEDKPLRWKAAWVDRRRYYAPPTLHQPLSHAASRRDSSPFRGAEGVGGGLRRLRACLPRCGYCGFPPARKGRRPRRPAVAGLPGWVVADVERDRFCPRHPRRARLRPPPSVCNPAGAARAPFGTGAEVGWRVEPTSSVDRRKGRRGRRPYGGCVWVGFSIKPPLPVRRG